MPSYGELQGMLVEDFATIRSGRGDFAGLIPRLVRIAEENKNR